MIVALWICALALAAVYLATGITKLRTPVGTLAARMPWVGDFSATQVKAIGAVEVVGALGVILPLVTGIAPAITAAAALGLLVLQAAAIAVHVRRGETRRLAVNVVLALLAVVVAVLALVA